MNKDVKEEKFKNKKLQQRNFQEKKEYKLVNQRQI